MIGSLIYLTSLGPDIMFAVCACAHFQVTTKVSHLHAVKRIFRYLKGKPHLGLWYPKDSPFNSMDYLDSDYAGASLDMNSTTGGCQFLGCRLISRQCKKQTVVATSSTKAEYIATASCYAQVALNSIKSLNKMLHVTNISSAGYITTPRMVLNSPLQPTSPPSLIAQPPSSQQQPQSSQDGKISMDLLYTLLETCTTLTKRVEHLEHDKIAQSLEITKLKQRVKKLEKRNKLKGRFIASMDTDVNISLQDVANIAKEVPIDAEIEKSADVQGRQVESQAQIYQIDLEHVDKVLSMQNDKIKLAELQEVVEVVTTSKLMTEVVSAASATITAIITAAAPKLTTTPSAARRRKGLVIRDHEEIATPSNIIHSEPKSKDKGKGILVQEPKPLKKQARIEQDEAYARELEAELNKNINWDDRANESQAEKAAKRQKLDGEVSELKRHLQIVPNDEDDVYTEATPLSRKSFLTLLKNFDREDLEVLWQLVKERFASSKPKNFLDDFWLATLIYMFEKPDVQAQVWKNQRTVHGLANVKS
nr:uncharacterized mitochondrial protein AtMg00810-like [Tanacetum cinerariifolium]